MEILALFQYLSLYIITQTSHPSFPVPSSVSTLIAEVSAVWKVVVCCQGYTLDSTLWGYLWQATQLLATVPCKPVLMVLVAVWLHFWSAHQMSNVFICVLKTLPKFASLPSPPTLYCYFRNLYFLVFSYSSNFLAGWLCTASSGSLSQLYFTHPQTPTTPSFLSPCSESVHNCYRRTGDYSTIVYDGFSPLWNSPTSICQVWKKCWILKNRKQSSVHGMGFSPHAFLPAAILQFLI